MSVSVKLQEQVAQQALHLMMETTLSKTREQELKVVVMSRKILEKTFSAHIQEIVKSNSTSRFKSENY